MQFMSQIPFESFLINSLIEQIKARNLSSTKFHYICSDPDKAKKLLYARTLVPNTISSTILIDGVAVPLIETVWGSKLIIMLHDSAVKDKETFSEDFIANVRDAINDLENTSLFVIHNSALETILTSCQDLSTAGQVFTAEYVSGKLDDLAKKHSHKGIVEAICDKQRQDVEEQNLSIFGYEALYNSIIKNELKFEQHGLFNDERLLDFDDKRAIKNDIKKNSNLYNSISSLKHDYSESKDELNTELEKLGFGEKFIKDNLVDSDKWKSLKYSDIEDEIEANKTRKLVYEQLEVNGKKHSFVKSHDAKKKNNSVLIEAMPGALEIKFRFSKGDTLLKKDEIAIVGDYSLKDFANPQVGNYEKNSVITAKCNYDGKPKLFQLKLNRNSSGEKIQFNFVLIPHNSFNLVNVWEKLKVEFKRNKGQLNFENVTDELVFNEQINESVSVTEPESLIDLAINGRVNFLSLLQKEDTLTARLKFKDNELPINIFGKANLESIKLPSILDESRAHNILSLEGVAQYKSKCVVYSGKEKELSVGARQLCKIESDFADKELLYLEEDTGEQFTISEIRLIDTTLADYYHELYVWLKRNKTIISLTSWPVELQSIVTKLLEQFNSLLNSLPNSSLSTEHKKLVQIGMYHGAFDKDDIPTDWLTPFHPIVLSYMLHLVKLLEGTGTSISSLPKVTLDKLNPAGLLPIVYDSEFDYAFSKPATHNRFWLQIAPQQQSNQSYVAKLVQEKLQDFSSCFSMLFERNNSTSLLINSIHNQRNEYVFAGIVDYFRKKKLAALNVHITMYDDRLHNSLFDQFSESKNIDTQRELVRKTDKEKVDETDTLISLIKNKLTYSKKTAEKEYDYAHISFFKNNEKVKLVDKLAISSKTGVSCTGLITGEASYLENDNYYTGFGLKGLTSFSLPVEFAAKYNSLFKPLRENTASYNSGVVPALAVKDTFKQSLKSSYKSSIWTCIIDPKVTLEFFDEKNTLLVHYSDKYTSSTAYDAITISSRIDLYRGLLKEESSELVSSFNAISGQWLLDVVKAAGKPQTTSVQNDLKEKQGIVAAYKFIAGLLLESDITWVPLSIAELIRVTGNLGLKISESDFAARLQNKKLNVMSDDLLFVGFKSHQMYLLPLEVKTREKGNDFTKAIKQAIELKNFMYGLLAEQTLKGKVYRSLFMQHVLTQVERYELYKLFPSDYFSNLLTDKEFYQQGMYQLCDVENYVNGFAIAFKNDLKTARTNPKVDPVSNMLTAEISFGWMRYFQSNQISVISDKLQSKQELPELKNFILKETIEKQYIAPEQIHEDDIKEVQAIIADDINSQKMDEEVELECEPCHVEFEYPDEFEKLIENLLINLKRNISAEDILALTEGDLAELLDNSESYLLPFFRLKEFLNDSVQNISARNENNGLLLKDILVDQDYKALSNLILRSISLDITVDEVIALKDQQMLALNGFGSGKLEKFNEFKQALASGEYSVSSESDTVIVSDNYDIGLAELETELSNSLENYLNAAKDRDKQVFTRRLGINRESETLEEIGKGFGVTRERIRQIEKKAKQTFLSNLTVSQRVIKAVVQANLSELREPLFPTLRIIFSNRKQFYMFLELCCGLEENEIRLIINPSLSREAFNEFWLSNKSPAPLEDLTWHLHETADIDIAVAENQILRWHESGYLDLTDEYVKPLRLPKVETITNTLLDFPNGVAWQLLQTKAADKNICSNDMLIDRPEPGIGAACDRELIYQSGRGTYRHLSYLEISDHDIQYILNTVKSKLQEYSYTKRDSVNLSVDICDNARFVQDYFVIRYVVRTFGETVGIYFNGKSGADTVSLNSEFSLASQRTVLASVFEESITPLTKQDVASRIRSNSLGHAAFYMDLLLTEGTIVRVDDTSFAHVKNAFSNYDVAEIMEHVSVFIAHEKNIIEGECIQTYLNRKLDLQLNKYFYISLLKVHASAYGLTLYFVQNLISKIELQEKGLADFCRQALQVTSSNKEAVEWVKAHVTVYEHVVKRILSQVTNSTQKQGFLVPEASKIIASIEPQEDLISSEGKETIEPQNGISPPKEVTSSKVQIDECSQQKENENLSVLVGHEKQTGEPVYWEPTNTAKFMNTNSGIIGTMGTGKTQCTKSVVTQLYRNQHNNVDGKPIGILIFDYKSDYVDDKFIDATNGKKFNLHKLPYNPLSLFGDTPMLPVHTARGFSETMGKAFNLGTKQQLKLRKLIGDAYDLAGIHKANKSTWSKAAPTMGDLWSLFLDSEPAEDSLYAALESICELEIFEDDTSKCMSLYDLVDGITVVELAGYPGEIQNLVVALTLDLFYSQMQKQGKPEVQGDFRQVTKLVLVDEADNFMSQNFPSLRKILKEGREYGVGVILSTQDITHFKTSENDYSAYILSWIVHRVSQIKTQDIKGIFNKDDKSEQELLMKNIRELEKHTSLYIDGEKQIKRIKDKAFWELLNDG